MSGVVLKTDVDIGMNLIFEFPRITSGPLLEFHLTLTIGIRLCFSCLTSRSMISTGFLQVEFCHRVEALSWNDKGYVKISIYLDRNMESIGDITELFQEVNFISPGPIRSGF
ncbi:hypothetical protein Tco_0726536 [Tanacetum coccineum]|uniref:Uncharacterized protein n=1 Tax=Tanacetum coccineum TaxID=301880 RepID=A0ABQ4YGR9_9ASTR